MHEFAGSLLNNQFQIKETFLIIHVSKIFESLHKEK